MLITRPFALLLCAAVPVLLSGCGKEASPAKSGAAPTIDIRIGHVAPLTGSIPHLGKDNENGARLAIEELNAARIMIDGRQANFVLQAEDDQEDEKVAPTVAQKLVDAKKLAVKATIDHAALKAAGVARGGKDGVRLLAKGELTANQS